MRGERQKALIAEVEVAEDVGFRDQPLLAAQIGRTWRGILEAPARHGTNGAWRMRTANNRKVIVTIPEPSVDVWAMLAMAMAGARDVRSWVQSHCTVPRLFEAFMPARIQ